MQSYITFSHRQIDYTLLGYTLYTPSMWHYMHEMVAWETNRPITLNNGCIGLF